MKSGWVDRDAEAIVAEGAKSGIDRDLALRIYTTRLLGRDPKLVLHGGGNTSLKEVMRDRLGADVEVLRVKATGADMAMIDLAGLPAVRLSPLRKLRALNQSEFKYVNKIFEFDNRIAKEIMVPRTEIVSLIKGPNTRRFPFDCTCRKIHTVTQSLMVIKTISLD